MSAVWRTQSMLLRCTPGPVRLLGCPPRLLKLGPKCVFQSEEENDPKANVRKRLGNVSGSNASVLLHAKFQYSYKLPKM